MAAKTRWGILATGWIADLFVKDLLLTGHSVTAVGSRSPVNADRFAKRFGIPNSHGSYESLAADPEVDVIYIATPHPMHAANAKMALAAGKHVLIEKPFTLNAAEAGEVVALAQANRLVALDHDKKLLSRDITVVDLRLPDRVSVRLSDATAQARDEALKANGKKKKGGDA